MIDSENRIFTSNKLLKTEFQISQENSSSFKDNEYLYQNFHSYLDFYTMVAQQKNFIREILFNIEEEYEAKYPNIYNVIKDHIEVKHGGQKDKFNKIESHNNDKLDHFKIQHPT